MQLQNQLMHIGGQIQWKKAKPDHLRTTNGWLILQFPIGALVGLTALVYPLSSS